MSSVPAIKGYDHRFADPSLLAIALTHRSAGAPHNERLEFLGDAVLGLLVAEALYVRFPKRREGELTRLRAALVCEPSLAELARGLDLGEHLRLGPGELKSGGWRRDSILADAFEGVLGATFVDGGLDAARAALTPLLAARIEALGDGRVGKDPKTALQESLQGRGLGLPEYRLIDSEGAGDQARFQVLCVIEALAIETCGEGASRRAAETEAAAAALGELADSRDERAASA